MRATVIGVRACDRGAACVRELRVTCDVLRAWVLLRATVMLRAASVVLLHA
jgi:hypothetical protein